MNRIYQIIWSRVVQCWVVVAETSSRHTPHATRHTPHATRHTPQLKLLALALLLVGAEAQALPVGSTVTAGQATITTPSSNTMNITQSTSSLSINWQSFNVGAAESVVFNQPSAQAVAVNQVTGSAAASQILGNLSANGQVWLINPNGVLFGPRATVNVGGLAAATSLQASDNPAYSYLFSSTGSGSIINQGKITTTEGGYVALMANQVSNQGSIATPQGTTALLAGSSIYVNFPLVSPVNFLVTGAAPGCLAENTAQGELQADGGVVIMTAGPARYITGASLAPYGAVNNQGIIQARTITDLQQTGSIYLMPLDSYSSDIQGYLDVADLTDLTDKSLLHATSNGNIYKYSNLQVKSIISFTARVFYSFLQSDAHVKIYPGDYDSNKGNRYFSWPRINDLVSPFVYSFSKIYFAKDIGGVDIESLFESSFNEYYRNYGDNIDVVETQLSPSDPPEIVLAGGENMGSHIAKKGTVSKHHIQ